MHKCYGDKLCFPDIQRLRIQSLEQFMIDEQRNQLSILDSNVLSGI